MATVNTELTITLPAAADFSTTGQNLFVDVNATGQAALVGAGAAGIGVLSNNPASGEASRVVFAGQTKVEAGGTILGGALLAADASGAAVTAAAGDVVLARAIAPAVDGDIFEVLLVSKYTIPTP